MRKLLFISLIIFFTQSFANSQGNGSPVISSPARDPSSQAPRDDDRAVTPREFILDNGLKILVKEDHRAPVVISMIWYHVGSADEPGGITGVSHALEHLMFKSTAKNPKGVFSETIASLGGQDNAFTSYDYTVYYEKLSAKDLDVALRLESDRMHNLLLDPKEFAQEIKVIQEERRLRTDNNPQALTYERFLATAHLTTPYQHPVIGWMSDLKQMTVNDARTWYQRFYNPSNATLVIVGDVNPNHVYQLAKRYFNSIPASAVINRKLQSEPPPLGKKQVLVNINAQIPIIFLGYPAPSLKTVGVNNNDPYVLEVIGALLQTDNDGRFNQNLVRDKQIASAVEVAYNKTTRYQTQLVIIGAPNSHHNLTELKTAILQEIEKLKTQLVSEQELNRVKKQLIAQTIFQQDNLYEQALELGVYDSVGLQWKITQQYADKINQVTPAQIQKVARQYFQANHLTEAQLIPQR